MSLVEHCARAKLNRNYNHEKEKSSKEGNQENSQETKIVFSKNPVSFGGIFYPHPRTHLKNRIVMPQVL